MTIYPKNRVHTICKGVGKNDSPEAALLLCCVQTTMDAASAGWIGMLLQEHID